MLQRLLYLKAIVRPSLHSQVRVACLCQLFSCWVGMTATSSFVQSHIVCIYVQGSAHVYRQFCSNPDEANGSIVALYS